MLHRLFELQVAKTLNNEALKWEDDTPLTYDELNKASNHLAQYLRAHVPARAAVALFLENPKS